MTHNHRSYDIGLNPHLAGEAIMSGHHGLRQREHREHFDQAQAWIDGPSKHKHNAANDWHFK